MIERYSRKEIKNIWEDKNKYSIWLDIEIAAAHFSVQALVLVQDEKTKKI